MPETLRDECVPFRRRLTSYGVSFEIRASSASLLDEVCRALPPFTRVSTAKRVARRFAIRSMDTPCACGRRHSTALIRNGAQLVPSMQGDAAALDALRIWTKHFVSTRMRRALCVHAGVVAIGHRGVIIPGTSMSGKTTLTAALVRAGATYYSDEYALVGADGLIRPFPQQLGMRRPGSAEQVATDARALGAVIGSAPLTARLVIFSRFVEGARWTPRRMSKAETVMALLGHTVAGTRRPERTMTWLTRAVAEAVGVEGDRGDADTTARLILAQIDALPR